ncbi:PREDICTED: uncharacterized protein LOC108745943 [Trachymyrmex septentrionalis]|uniref:uncharacterized protein LOC108745943 n=1 Tax=Trachymyrmex septentrionalis TaxID=34720 RepID=UPI00084F522D|nr:PREDICTED: uncharacterized protein LOC108745943 [Trachymyrmex septentrionalis]
MSSPTISCRIFGCVLLILLLQYARKSYYLETILDSLRCLENMLSKQTERNTLCSVPTEKLRSLISDQISYDSNEPNENYIQYLLMSKKLKQEKKIKEGTARSLNANKNVNVNENFNTNLDAKRHHRRSFRSDDSRLRKSRIQNTNSNVNYNSNVNANDIFDAFETP